MIDKQTIAYLRLAHGSFNFIMMLFFMYQGWMGLRIRKNRLAQKQDFDIIKKHRKSGPFFAVLGVSGFLAGIVLVILDSGRIMKYPIHFVTGLAIVFSIISAYLISRKISGDASVLRVSHLRRGIVILCLYLVQVIIGLGMLF